MFYEPWRNEAHDWFSWNRTASATRAIHPVPFIKCLALDWHQSTNLERSDPSKQTALASVAIMLIHAPSISQEPWLYGRHLVEGFPLVTRSPTLAPCISSKAQGTPNQILPRMGKLCWLGRTEMDVRA